MSHRLRRVELDFLTQAPYRFTLAKEVRAPRRDVFAAICADPSTWTSWFPDLRSGGYSSAPPHGVGTIREVDSGGIRYRETLLAWDAPRRWAYRVDSCSQPVAAALAEDWVLEERGGATIVHWTFAVEPGPLLGPALDHLPELLDDVFGTAMSALGDHLLGPGVPDGGTEDLATDR